MTKMYHGRTALVTGAASGIGKFLVEHLTNNGATVICSDINEKLGQAAAASVNKGHTMPIAYFIRADVTSWDDVVAMFSQASKSSGGKHVDFVFPNAGVASLGFPDLPGKPNIDTFNVNVIGVLYTMQAAINHFRAFKVPGRIVVTASQASLHLLVSEPIYTASKHGVLGLVRATALRTEAEGILINAIGPGSTESNLMPQKIEKALNKRGLKTSKESIMKAFDLFLEPNSKLFGQLASVIGDKVRLHNFQYLDDELKQFTSKL